MAFPVRGLALVNKEEVIDVQQTVEETVVLQVVEGNPLLTELHDLLQEASEIWTSHDVWFDLDQQAIVGRKKRTACTCVSGSQLPSVAGPCAFCEDEQLAFETNGEVR